MRASRLIHPFDRLRAGESFEYAYDAAGNRTAMTDTAGVHIYDAANRLTSVDGVTYTWDARGNLTHDGTFTYTYNSAGRMVRAQSLTATLVYTYTSAGLRVAQSAQSGQSVFAWDWASGLPEMLSEGASVYLVGHDTLGQWDGAAWAYYLPDALGSVRQVADGAGAVVSAREWTPFGVGVGGAQAGLGYTGEYWDASVGLQYLRARWYAPYLNRFISPDTIVPDYRNPPSTHRYLYAFANPLRYTDPSGHDPLDPDWEREFRESHNERNPGTYDRLIRLFSITFPDEWEHSKFYNPDGELKDDDTIRDILATPGPSRTWEGMLPALQRLSAWYTPGEEEAFVRDVGDLFGGLPDRFSQPNGWDAVYTDIPDRVHHWAGLKRDGAEEYFGVDLIGGDWDANVHHWAWAFVLGYYTGPFGPAANTAREYEGGAIWVPCGTIMVPMLVDQNHRADVRMGNRAALMGWDVRSFGASQTTLERLWRHNMLMQWP